MFSEWTESVTFNYETSTVWVTKPRKSHQKSSGLLEGPEQGTRPKPLQAI